MFHSRLLTIDCFSNTKSQIKKVNDQYKKTRPFAAPGFWEYDWDLADIIKKSLRLRRPLLQIYARDKFVVVRDSIPVS